MTDFIPEAFGYLLEYLKNQGNIDIIVNIIQFLVLPKLYNTIISNFPMFKNTTFGFDAII